MHLLIALVMLLGSSAWADMTVRDDRGVKVPFAVPPQRIVTLLPSLTEIVCAVGACDRLVGVDRYSDWPASIEGLPRLGGMDDAQVERIVALRPDVVLAARSTRAVERLQALGLKVLAFDSDRHAQVHASMKTIGALLGRQAQADAAWARVQVELAAASARVPAALRGSSVYFEADATPFAAGEVSFVGETLAALGLRNVATAAMGPFPQLNPEFVVRAQPTVVMAARRNAAEMADRPGWRQLSALRSGRVCAFEPGVYEMLVRPGPRMGQAAQAIVDCLVRLSPPPQAAR